jgi:hypothetical protein
MHRPASIPDTGSRTDHPLPPGIGKQPTLRATGPPELRSTPQAMRSSGLRPELPDHIRTLTRSRPMHPHPHHGPYPETPEPGLRHDHQ